MKNAMFGFTERMSVKTDWSMRKEGKFGIVLKSH